MGVVRRRSLVIAVGLAVVLLSLVPLRLALAREPGRAATFDLLHSDLDPLGVRSFRAFPLYSLGDAHAGLPLTAITRRKDGGGAGYAADYVSFLYGSCVPAGGTGCPLPLEVQVWPACVRTLVHYRLTPFSDEPLPHEPLSVRGVPAALVRESPALTRLELYTGRVTVVVFGAQPPQLLAAAAALRGVNVSAVPGEPLPPPVAGALAGKLDCDDRYDGVTR
ncbi:MAG: hypothetical protein M3229_04530 [Actinomycetota bacterium]|nr:hypothetical protein [Actinomycetota bacterium]